ncbi:MAG: hypothetical protein Q8909_00635 [Bacteroidota bacterium]|nr:hypothetical protein [Bacteroidota bacterium]
MKKIILFSIINIFLLSVCIAQTDTTLQVIKRNSGKTVVIKENKKISIIRFDNSKVTGKLDIVSDSSIALNGDTILLKNINEIRKKTIGLSILGFLSTYLGVNITLGCLITLTSIIAELGINPISVIYEGLFIIITSPFIAAGVIGTVWGIKKFFIGNKYPHTKWIYRINPKPITQ